MIQITPAAADAMRRLLQTQGRHACGLRVGVKGGGCSGFSYILQFVEKPHEHDRVFEADGLRIFCDPKSYLYLEGLTLDYAREPIKEGFIFVSSSARTDCLAAASASR